LVTRPAREPIGKLIGAGERFELIKPHIRQSPAVPGFSFARSNCLIADRQSACHASTRSFTRCNFAAPETVRAFAHARIIFRYAKYFSLSQVDDITLPLCDPKLVGGGLP
jgi:hypothetical protein